MGKVRMGCVNETCANHLRKTVFDKGEAYCSMCGTKLQPVCKRCYGKLELCETDYCIVCKEEMCRQKEKRRENLHTMVDVTVKVVKPIAEVVVPIVVDKKVNPVKLIKKVVKK